jgi:hypothetical protein
MTARVSLNIDAFRLGQVRWFLYVIDSIEVTFIFHNCLLSPRSRYPG